MKLTDLDWKGDRIDDTGRPAAPGGTEDEAAKLPNAVSSFANGLPSPDLERLTLCAGVDASSLTDDQIAEALLQLR